MNEINLTHEKLSKGVLRRLGTFVLALCMTLSLLPAVLPPASAAFSDAAMDKLLNWGVVSGYPDGALHPDWSLTRAEFVAMVNRAYGYDELGGTPFIDVPNDAWFRDDVDIGYNANYFTGVSPRMAAPDQELTREQAVVLLARNMRMQPIDGEVTEFSDGHAFSDWSRGYVRAAKEAGVIGGYSDGSYKPKNSITRGEMAVMLQRALGTLINKPGVHTLSDVYGNVTISSPNVILTDSTIAGDLYITGGLSLGDVTLQNVRVLGNIIIAGGGESESGESVILRNVQADSLIVDSIAGQYLSLASEGDTLIGEAILRTSAYVQDRTRPGGGLLQITLDSLEDAAAFTLSGNLETVVNKTPNSRLNIAMGTVATLNIDEKARSSTLNLDINSTVETLNLDTAVTVTGVGDIGDLFVNAPGATIDMLPDTVTIRPGLTADVAGQTMNAQQAQESSADPRLLAGYPKARNIAPTNATSVYSANKAGTVYWAVSNATDGSIGEAELIEPTAENTSIALSGTTAVELSNTEYTAALENLTPDTNYYLSTVMTDAHGRHSPVKVASFLTPDNTVPAFSAGYPTVMKNYSQSIPEKIEVEINGQKVEVEVVKRDENGNPVRNYRVQVVAMPNKSCVLYYALYPSGSTAPTAQQFRTGALGAPLRSGMEDATKNRINFIELTGLDELTNYDLYLCYIDADGARSSPVQKLTFRTVDGTPPRFQYETPIVTQEQLTSLRLSVNVSEDATIYWVASRSDGYINNDDDWDDVEWWERACRQIESGTNSVSRGAVNARGNAETIINITGLQPATLYYIYFVAKDGAGNYSEFFRKGNTGEMFNPALEPSLGHPEQYTPWNEQPYKYFIPASTLDNIPPTAEQEFTHYESSDPTQPYADTDIMIHFSEAVMQYSAHRDEKVQENFKDFYILYTALVDARAAFDAVAGGTDTDAINRARDARNLAEDAFVNALSSTIRLYNYAEASNKSVDERNRLNEGDVDDNWVIDYRYATVEYDVDTGEMTVTFPTNSNDLSKSALNLSSGTTYHFILDDICDRSSSKNRMGRTSLPDFTTIAAQVDLEDLGGRFAYYTNPNDPNAKPEAIEMDFAFRLTPLSTNVEDSVMWDLLFWSDTSVKFEVFELDSGSSSNAVATPIRPLNSDGTFSNGNKGGGRHEVSISTSNIEAPDPDIHADNYLGYRGRSFFAAFYDVLAENSPSDGFPSVTGKDSGSLLDRYRPGTGMDEAATIAINPSGILEREVPKYYGIHITEINNVAESQGRGKIWNASVNFRISVVTSPNRNSLRMLSQNVSPDQMNDFLTNPDRSGSIIQLQKPFNLPNRFSNENPTTFETGFPGISPADTYVDLSFRLADNRLGTVYYVIAPVTRWTPDSDGVLKRSYTVPLPIATNYYNGTPSGVEVSQPDDSGGPGSTWYERWYADLGSGNKVYVPRDGADNTTSPNFPLALPTNYDIYNAGYTNPDIKKDSVPITDTSLTQVRVEGLQPQTVYFVYLVTQTEEGQVYSERTLLYQFTTSELDPPRLTVMQTDSNHASISTTKDNTEVYAALYRADQLNNFEYLTQLFFTGNTYLDPSRDASALLNRTDTTGKRYREYTVWEALRGRVPAGLGLPTDRSLFDYFAREEVKDTVAGIIQNMGDNAGNAQVRNQTVNAGAGNAWFPDFTLEDGFEYIVFAVGGLPGASGHSRSFGAAGLLKNPIEDLPTISTITGSVTVDYRNTSSGYRMYGQIMLEFNKPLYLYYPSDFPELAEHVALTRTMVPNDFIDSDATPSSYAEAFTASSSDSSAVQNIVIRFPVTWGGTAGDSLITGGGITSGAYFIVNNRLSTEAGEAREPRLQIRIRYDAAEEKVYAEVMASGSDWYPVGGGVQELQTDVLRPDPPEPAVPDDFYLNATEEAGFSLGLINNDSRLILGTLSPANADGGIQFSWEGPEIVTIEPVEGSKTSVTVKSIGTLPGSSDPENPNTQAASGTLVATLLDANGAQMQPLKQKRIPVRVNPEAIGYVNMRPDSNYIILTVGSGMAATQTIELLQKPTTDPTKQNLLTSSTIGINRNVSIDAESNAKVAVTLNVANTQAKTGQLSVAPQTGYNPTNVQFATFTIQATDTVLVDSLTVTVEIRPGN